MASDPSLEKRILKLLGEDDYRPLDAVEMSAALRYKSDDRAVVRRTLQSLEQSGRIVRVRKNRFVLPAAADLVTGKMSLTPAGYGFLIPEEERAAGDIFISSENIWTAMHGDRVVARLVREGRPRPRPSGRQREEARVIRILQRAHETLVGTLQHSKHFHYVVPDDPRFVHNIYVRLDDAREVTRQPVPGDKVVVKLEPWESRHVNPEGVIIELLGKAGEPGVDILSIIRKYHLPTHFPEAVLAEAEAIPEKVSERMCEGREDLRDEFIITIDPDDARDFDDAIHVLALEEGGWRLGVHIADVSYYVGVRSALDREAAQRGNSVYLPDRVLPMLPERLSNGVCSLRPDVDRLTYSVFIDFTRSGRMSRVRFARTVIRSARRLTYKEAYRFLQHPASDELGQRLHTAWSLAATLRRNRFEHGSLDLDFPEVKVRLDARGRPATLERVENDESHQLIEEFMLAANEAVARELKNRLVPSLYRIHENPDPDKLAEFRELVLSHGFRAGDLTQRAELQRLLSSLRGKPEEQAFKIALLKSLKRARYAPVPLGHYGLAKNNYTHFTSPIRRYADLVVHRSLASLQKKTASSPDSRAVSSVADHISATERVAAEAEIEAVRLKKLEYFQLQLNERVPQVFKAVVIDIRNYGLLVELPAVVMTGMIHSSALSDDFYIFDPVQRQMIGRRHRRRYRLGQELEVIPARVDFFKRQVDFAPATAAPASPRSKPRSKKGRR